MKTIKFPEVFALIAFATLFTVSCSKQADSPFSDLTPPEPTGSIVDMGPLDNGVRIMMVTLAHENFTVTDPKGETFYTPAQVNVTFYVDQDGGIPSGQYAFSNSDIVTPFTFNSANFAGSAGSNGLDALNEEITGGIIIVTQASSDTYRFEFQGQVYTGHTFAGTCDCSMSYKDEI